MTTENKPLQCQGCPLLDQRRIKAAGKNSAKIVLVGECPSKSSPQGGIPFQDREGHILTTALKQIQEKYWARGDEGIRRWQSLELYKTYAAQCLSDDKPSKAALDRCRVNLEQALAVMQPKIIVAFGATAMRSLIREKVSFDEVRGTLMEYTLGSVTPVRKIPLMVTYGLKALLAQQGLYDEMFRDLQRAHLFAEGKGEFAAIDPEKLRQGYVYPRTVEEVAAVCQEILDYHHEGQTAENHLIAVDTETTTLEMYDTEAKIIMVSLAWDVNKATSIVIDHPQAWWTPEDLAQVKYHVQRVLASAKPKCLHNSQFDMKGIVFRYGWKLENVVWDTMGVEHLLEEDKKGAYGLKSLTRTRLPQYAGYEDKVHELREEHGGLTRTEAARKFRRDMAKFEDRQASHAVKMDTYEKEYAAYLSLYSAWSEKKQEERQAAKAEKRKMDKAVFGKPPRKPPRPKAPVMPEKEDSFDFTLIPLDDLEFYAAVDADVTRQHVYHQVERLNAEYRRDVAVRKQHGDPAPPRRVSSLIKNHVLPLSKTLSLMEFTGVPVDIPYIDELTEKLKITISETERKIYDIAGDFNISSTADVITVLFNRGFNVPDVTDRKITVPTVGIPVTKRGQHKSDEKTLLFIANKYGYELPKLILTYRKALKAKNTFLVNVRERAVYDKRMHSSFHMVGTATGRLSSSGENLQNCPAQLSGLNIKKMFIPPEGNTFVDMDAKGAEVRIFAAYSMDAKLIEAITGGLDPHSFFSSIVHKREYEEIERARKVLKKKSWQTLEEKAYCIKLDDDRSVCKRVVFGTLYGAMAAKIAETAGIPLDEAQEVIDLMFQMFPSIPAYIEATHRDVLLYGGVYTHTGRKRRFPLANMRMFRNRCFRQAVNFRIQGTNSDIIMWVLNQIAPVIVHDMMGQLHLTVHDSIGYSVPHKYVSQVPDMVQEYGTRRVKEAFPWLPVPFLWDIKAGPSYGETCGIADYIEELKKNGKIEPEVPEEELLTDAEYRQELTEAADQ